MKAVVASVAAVLLLISMCSFAQNTNVQFLYTRLRLSEDTGDRCRESAVCEGTQKDTGSLSSDEGFRFVQASEPRTKKRKVLLWKEEAEEGAVGPSGFSSPLRIKREPPLRPQEWGVQQGQLQQPVPSSSGEGSETAYHLPDPPGKTPKPSTQQPPTGSLHEGEGVVLGNKSAAMAPEGRSFREVLAATALLLLHEPSGIAGGSDTEKVHRGHEEPQPSTFAAGMEGSLPAGVVRARLPMVKKGDVQRAPCPVSDFSEVELQQFAVAPMPEDADEDPALADLYPPSLVPPVDHPFSRLPGLNPGGVPKKFDPVRALYPGIASSQPGRLLVNIRELFAKASLSQQEADMLVEKTERLVAHCHYHQKAQASRTDSRRAADLLATRFLLLEAIVSAFIITGQHPSASWWRHFVAGVPHEVFLVQSERLVYFKSRHKLLATALSRGLAALKKGIRPNDKDVFKYKYMIFCLPRNSEVFNRPLYSPWRSDCSRFAGPNKALSSSGGAP